MVVGDRIVAEATGRFLELAVEPDRWAVGAPRFAVHVIIGHEGSSTSNPLPISLRSEERAVALAAHLRAQLGADFRHAEEERVRISLHADKAEAARRESQREAIRRMMRGPGPVAA
jgi:hypothetical protein